MAIRNSHIIPEFFYKGLYDAKGRFQVFAEGADRPSQFVQKGFREHLLCGNCEAKLSKWEKYVKELLYDKAPIGLDRGDRMEYSGLEYAQVKLFQMSLLWRMHITTIPHFDDVNLGVKHAERLRQMINAENPGEPYDYGCWLNHFALSIPEHGCIILPPTASPVKVDGHYCYRVGLGGILWCFFVSSHMDRLISKDRFILKSGILSIWKENDSTRHFVHEMTEAIAHKFGQ